MKNLRLRGVLLLSIVVIGGFLTWWVVSQVNGEMQNALLQQTRLMSKAVNIEDVQALSGTEADLNSPHYKRLKEALAVIRSSNAECRFAYLFGRKADGSLFFFADNEPPDSKDYSAPGQVYNEATYVDRRVFASRDAAVEGPTADRWGKWVSALVPILDHQKAIYGLASQEDARAMVRKAVKFYRKNGREQLLEEINNPRGEFVKRDLYAFVYDRSMTMLAHPVNPGLIGHNQLETPDWSGGTPFRRKMKEVARSKGYGWVDYQYKNPVNGQLDYKTTYFEGVNELIICAGAYRGTGDIVALLGIDIDARSWNRKLARAALPPAALSLALCVIFLLGSALFTRRSLGTGGTHRLRHLEPALATAVGLVLTLFAAHGVHERELHDRKEAFVQLAASRTGAIAEMPRALITTQLEGLAGSYERNTVVPPDKFLRITAGLAKNTAVQAWGWIPVVASTGRASFEEQVRVQGGKKFEIWQKDADGQRVLASARDVYYPALQVAPVPVGEGVLGYDVGSEPVRRAALEEAMRTGLATVTGPIGLLQDAGSQKGVMVFRPVFDPDNLRLLRGFAVAVVNVGSLLELDGSDQSVTMAISLLNGDAAPEPLAASWDADSPPLSGLFETRPFFAFGKMFAVTAYAGPEFMRLHPVWGGLLTVFTGLLLTAALASVIGIVVRRREKLERLILERTASLKERKARFDQLAEQSGTIIWEMDPRGLITYVSHVVEQVLGYRPEELVEKKYFYDLSLEPEQADLKARALAAFRQKKPYQNVELAVQTKGGRHIWISSNGIPLLNSDGTLQGFRGSITDITERNKAAEALRESEEICRTVVENIGIGIAVIDPQMNVLKMNAHLQAMYPSIALSSNQTCYKTFHIPPLSGVCSYCPTVNTMEDGMVHESITKTQIGGEIRNHRIVSSPIKNDHGEVVAVVEMVEDITERKRAEEEIRKSELSYRNQFANNSAVMILVDPEDGAIIDANAAALRFYGYPRECLLAMHITDINMLPACETRQAMISVPPGEGRHFEFQHRLANGSLRDVEVSSSSIQSGGRVFLHSIIHDITERKQSEERLRLQGGALEASANAIVITDNKGVIAWVNPAFSTYTGYSISEAIGQTPSILKSGKHDQSFYHILWETVLAGEVWRGEMINRRKNGDFYTEEMTITPMKDSDGCVTHFIAVKQDITERKRAEAELQHFEIQLRHAQKMESIGRLAAGIAHEINTPIQFVLNNIVFLRDAFANINQLYNRCFGLIQRLKAGTLKQEDISDIGNAKEIEQLEYFTQEIPLAIQQSVDGVDRVAQIVCAMREFSHPGSEQPIPTNLNLAIASTLTVCRSEWKRVAELVTHFDPTLPLVPCFSSEINQAVLNMVVNACYAIADAQRERRRAITEDGPDSPLQGSQDSMGVITVTTQRDGDWAVVSISDTGLGIPEDVRTNIFDPFFTTKDVGEGSGIGLAITHAIIVKKHGGTIAFETEAGRGTTFVFRLPLNGATILI